VPHRLFATYLSIYKVALEPLTWTVVYSKHLLSRPHPDLIQTSSSKNNAQVLYTMKIVLFALVALASFASALQGNILDDATVARFKSGLKQCERLAEAAITYDTYHPEIGNMHFRYGIDKAIYLVFYYINFNQQ